MALTLVFILILQGLCESEALSVKGKERQQVKITCSHSNADSNMKYFCKEQCRDEDVLIRSSKTKNDTNGRYRIEDKGNTFNVFISNLNMNDSGNYRCGIDRAAMDTYTYVFITVEKGEKDTKENSAKNAKPSFSRKLVYIGAGLGVVVLVLAVVLLIFLKHQRRIIHSSSGGRNPETIHTMSFKKEDGNHDTPPAIDHHGPTCSTKNSAEKMYSTVSPKPQNKTDDLLYSTVSFVKHSDVRSTIEPNSTTEYSSLNIC